jgi:ZIP family zinc transporter
VWLAAGWGLAGGLALVIGAGAALIRPVPSRTIGLAMALGAGVLISALSIELAQDAFERGGGLVLAVGLAAGAVTFFTLDRLIDRHGGRHRKRCGTCRAPESGSANAIVLGSLLDGIPESVVIGAAIVTGDGAEIAVVVAVFLSNVPEALSAGTGLRKAGHSPRWILSLWGSIALASTAAAGTGYLLLGGAAPVVVAATQAFAAGAVLTMLADTMMPEAFAHAGKLTGLLTASGFTVAFLLSQL